MTEAITDYPEAVAYLERHIGLGMKPGLERIARLLEMMGEPHLGYPIVHVTGSNGKTSTVRIVSAVLAAHGLTAGGFTSPHLERWEERLSLNGYPVGEEELAAAVADVAPFVDLHEQETGDRASLFELLAGVAFAWFAERAVDVGVVEVGMGGRLDATNAAEGRVAVITGISLEHTEILGSTAAEIAAEKVAICKPGSVLVTGPLSEEVVPVVAEHVERVGATWRRFGEDFRLEDARMAVGGWLCGVSGIYDTYPDLELHLHGRHQLRNLAVALAACEELFGRALSPEATREGVAGALSLGRMEVVGRQPVVLLDGAHNPEGFSALAAALDEEFPEVPWKLVVGALGDKDLSMVGALAGRVDEVFATAPDYHRAVSAAAVASACREAFGPEVTVHEVATVPEAVTRALAAAGPEGAVLVAGSIYVVGEARTMLAEPPDGPGLVRARVVPPEG